jgi:hypothetical protein
MPTCAQFSGLSFQPAGSVCDEGLSVFKGRDRTVTFLISDPPTDDAPDGDLGDLTGTKIWFLVKKALEDEDSLAVIDKRSLNNGGSDTQAKVTVETNLDPVTGEVRNKEIEVYLEPADTNALIDGYSGDYVFDCVIEIPSGARLQLFAPSTFDVEQPVTRAL